MDPTSRRFCDFSLQLIFRMPAVSRGHCAGTSEVGPGAPEVDKLRAFFNHPDFIEATVERVRDALGAIPAEAGKTYRLFIPRTVFRFHGEYE